MGGQLGKKEGDSLPYIATCQFTDLFCGVRIGVWGEDRSVGWKKQIPDRQHPGVPFPSWQEILNQRRLVETSDKMWTGKSQEFVFFLNSSFSLDLPSPCFVPSPLLGFVRL